MPEIRVRCRAQYITGDVDRMRQTDYDATHLVKAVKGVSLNKNQWAVVQIGKKKVTITDKNKDVAIQWFAEWAALLVDALGSREKVIVPIPGSSVTKTFSNKFRTEVIANAIAEKCETPVRVYAGLRWKRPQESTRDGGTRDPMLLYDRMVVLKGLPTDDIILIDDVYTTGGHLKAAAWCFEDRERRVLGAICCGRTIQQQLVDPFKVKKESLDLQRPN